MAARQNTRKLAWVPRTSLVVAGDEETRDFEGIAGIVLPELRGDLERARGETEELHHGKLPPSKRRFFNRTLHLCVDLERNVEPPLASSSGHRHERADQSYAELLVLYSMFGDIRFMIGKYLKRIQDSKRTADYGRMLGAPDPDGWWQMIKVGDIVGLFGTTFTAETVRTELKEFYAHYRFDEFSI